MLPDRPGEDAMSITVHEAQQVTTPRRGAFGIDFSAYREIDGHACMALAGKWMHRSMALPRRRLPRRVAGT